YGGSRSIDDSEKSDENDSKPQPENEEGVGYSDLSSYEPLLGENEYDNLLPTDGKVGVVKSFEDFYTEGIQDNKTSEFSSENDDADLITDFDVPMYYEGISDGVSLDVDQDSENLPPNQLDNDIFLGNLDNQS
ncbi:hypothetical protein K0B04_04050, partial [Patescibacteria group bacterium]|nr:hypothetical protein [Patescibacteria group bacterium]